MAQYVSSHTPGSSCLPNEFDPKVEYRGVHQLRPLGRTARRHPKGQIEKLAGCIRQFGFTNPILIDDENAVLAGLGRLEAAKLLLMTTVPVIVASHLTPVEKRAYVLAENKLSELGDWDRDILGEELRELVQMDRDFDIEIIGFNRIEIENLTRLETEHDLNNAPRPPLVPVAANPRCSQPSSRQTRQGRAAATRLQRNQRQG